MNVSIPHSTSSTSFIKYIPFFILGLIFFFACKPEKSGAGYTLRIRLKEDVDCLHPILSRSGSATHIEPLVMLPLIEYDLEKIELQPLLVNELPKITGSNDSATVFECDIRKEAKWDDGSEILASDYAFTVKAGLNPFIKNPSWRSFLKNIKTIELDPSHPKHLKIHIEKNYLLSEEMCGNFNLYRETHYDPGKIMSKFQIAELVYNDSSAWAANQLKELQDFARAFESAEMCKSNIHGSGPYKLVSWDAGSKIVFEKKENWWGNKLTADNPMLVAYPDRIEYLIMPDEAAVILGLKDGSIDLATDITPKQFDVLRNDETYKNKLQFFTPTIFQYAFVDINTRHPALSERNVRRALAHIIDINSFIKDVMQGLAEPIAGPVPPSRSYYNKNLKFIEFSPSEAASLLKTSGWQDSDNNGILDKKINGKKTELSFNFLVSTESGKKLALLFQEEAKKLGINIIPELKDFSLINKDLNELKFDLAILILGQSPSLYDPYQSWHSSNTKAGGSNRSGFATPETDSLIQIIRTTGSNDDRNAAYLKFQEILYNEQAQIFLFSPKQRIIASERIKLEASSRRPGFAENQIQLKQTK